MDNFKEHVHFYDNVYSFMKGGLHTENKPEVFEEDEDHNNLNVFINYKDSGGRRLIETASGMEKAITSLAIRVALINVSSLTKTNILIIDEGFGALDETNIEACTRLLESLKKWFRNIIVISHVDAIKDSVDNSLDIIRHGKDTKVYSA